MKRALRLFWTGLTGIFVGIANWITTILGMNDNSKYGKFLRRVVGTSFALFVFLCSTGLLYGYCNAAYEHWKTWQSKKNNDFAWSGQYVSRNLTFYASSSGKKGYVANMDGKKLIKGVTWVCRPLGNDSLAVYSDGEKRGYFNRYTGEVVIKPTYTRAWIFSDGLASVEIDGMIKFIDAKGNIALDPHVPYVDGMEGYVFHNNLCVLRNEEGTAFGVIDKQGKWRLEPEYDYIELADTFYIVNKITESAVLAADLSTVIPMMPARFERRYDSFWAVMSDHSIRIYNLKGELLNPMHITDVQKLLYQTDKVVSSSKDYEDDPELRDTDYELANALEWDTPNLRLAVANCRKYESEWEWYGLMSPSGKVLTPPSYRDIKAIGPDLYLCKDADYGGILLNGRGQRIK